MKNYSSFSFYKQKRFIETSLLNQRCYVVLMLSGIISMFLFSTTSYAQSVIDFETISDRGSSENWIVVKSSSTLTPQDILASSSNRNVNTFEQIEETIDQLGMYHQRHQQYYRGYPIEGAQVLFHGRDNRVNTINHSMRTISRDDPPSILLTEVIALEQLLQGINASLYAWESPEEEATLKTVKNNPTATYYPEGKIVWIKPANSQNYQLTYRFDVYSLAPLARKYYYVDVETGVLIETIDRIAHNCFKHEIDSNKKKTEKHHSHTNDSAPVDVAATGISSYVTANNSVVDFTTDDTGGQYILKANNLGNSGSQVIHTQNANNATSSSNLTDFTDADNYWENDPVGVSVHWGTIETFNYFETNHNRNSFDNNGADLFSRVHFGDDLVNAFWDGTQMTYGDGDGTEYSALTSLDVVSHEITHAVTQYNSTNGLIYQNESGALNESFSDIFGAAVEFTAHPDGGDWLMGEDFDLVNGVGFRNMENPNLRDHPKTYGGQHWHTAASDNGGVHINSGVQNHWFYLLTTGGSGTNEYGISYNIAPISMTDAAAIAYRNLTTYLTPNAIYPDARNGSIQAAMDLFPNSPAHHLAVQEAWCAVGVGAGCLPTISIQLPVASELVTAGQDYMIQWSSDMLTATTNVKIEFTTALDGEWTEIVGSTPNSGTYSWFVPNIVSSDVRLRITDLGDPSTGRPSNAAVYSIGESFTIQACIANPSFSFPSAILNEPVTFTSLINGTSYEWSINGTIVGNSKDLTYTFSQTGFYSVVYTVNSPSGCVNIEEQIIGIIPENANGFTIKIGETINGKTSSPQDVFQSKNGDYLVLSYGGSLLSCYDAQGNKKWNSGGRPAIPSFVYDVTIAQKDNGNYLIVTSLSDDFITQGHDLDKISIKELDGTDGTVVTTEAVLFEGTGALYPEEILNTTNGGFIIAGEMLINDQRDIFLLELDASLNKIATTFYGDSSSDEWFSKIIKTSDGGYLLSGTQYIDNTISSLLAVKIDAALTTEWSKKNHISEGTYSGIRTFFQINLIELLPDDGYALIAGSPTISNFFIDRPQSYLIRLDKDGNYLSAAHFSTPGSFEEIILLDGVNDGTNGITLLGASFDKHFLFNINETNVVQWSREFSSIPVTSAASSLCEANIIRTADGGYLGSLPADNGHTNYLYKTDRLGMINCDIKPIDISVTSLNGFSNHANFITNLSTTASIQSLQPDFFNPATIDLSVQVDCSYQTVSSVIASFYLESCYFDQGSSPTIINTSHGATNYVWEINGVSTAMPFPPFNTPGEYVIKLTASDGTTTSSVSKTIYILPVDSDCSTPTNMSAVYHHGTQSFTMSWDAVSGATAYEVRYRPIGGTYINTTPTGLSYTVSGLAFNTAYEYTVKAICPRGESAWVTSKIVRPSTGMTTTIDGNDPCCIVISNVTTRGYSDWYIAVDNTTLTAQDFVNETAYYCTSSNGSYDVSLYVNDAVGSTTTKEITDCNSGGSSGSDGSCSPTKTVSGTLNGVDIYQASQTITSDATIASGANVEFIAGESITLLPDFETQPGSVFYAHIDECSASPCSVTDSLALVAFYNATDGPNWTTTWDLSQPFDTWYGVGANSDGCVAFLDLGDNNLVGTIPSDIGNLANLDDLYLYNNQLTGTIPIELGNLSKLRFIYLFNNQLTGTIPTELGNLSNLVEIYLDRNQLTGTIPIELGNLSNLLILNLGNNQLTGSVPPELGNLNNLVELHLGGNQLTGTIPIELGNLSNLTWLRLNWNQLTGVIPTELGNLSNLINLDLYDNQLTGTIPKELGNLSNLVRLYLYDNQLTGTIPKELGNLSNLDILNLNNNQLTGSIPPELGNLSSLVQIYLFSNQLSGCFDPNLTFLCNIDYSFLYNPNLPGGGDFDAFCSNNTGACPQFTGQEETAFKVTTSNSHIVTSIDLSIIPNPVNKEAVINYELPESSQIDLAIYNMQGKVMQVLHNKEELGAGVHQQLINASTLPSGIYFIRLGTETQHKIIRMTVTEN